MVRLDVTGPDGFHVRRETAITVRPARGATTMVAGEELAPGAETQLAPPLDQFVAGTWRASARFGGAVRYDVGGLVQALDRYPLWCLEQATSRGLPLALLPDGPVAGPDRAARLQQAVGFGARSPAVRRRVRAVVGLGGSGTLAVGNTDDPALFGTTLAPVPWPRTFGFADQHA